jgi:carboxylate-amine ligase
MSAVQDPVQAGLPDHRFGVEAGYPLGLEEELLIVDPSDQRLLPAAERVIAAAAPCHGRLASEIFAAEVELVTPICHSIDNAAASLSHLLKAVCDTGATVIGAGLHPTARPGEAELLHSPRYEKVSDDLRGLLRTPPAGLHVHVGMPDPEAAIRACNGLRRHLPLLHSLGANSPFWYGRDSGLASARAAVLRSYPRICVPRWFRDYEDYVRVSCELVQAAGVADYTYLWWEVRPHPRLGTIEVRSLDAQFSLERALALGALIHALACMEAAGRRPPYQSRDAIEEACYQGTRYGLDAMLPDGDGQRRPERALARDALRMAWPHAVELGCDAALEGIERILRDGTGADVQRRVHRERGMNGLLEWLVRHRASTASTGAP